MPVAPIPQCLLPFAILREEPGRRLDVLDARAQFLLECPLPQMFLALFASRPLVAHLVEALVLARERELCKCGAQDQRRDIWNERFPEVHRLLFGREFDPRRLLVHRLYLIFFLLLLVARVVLLLLLLLLTLCFRTFLHILTLSFRSLLLFFSLCLCRLLRLHLLVNCNRLLRLVNVLSRLAVLRLCLGLRLRFHFLFRLRFHLRLCLRPHLCLSLPLLLFRGLSNPFALLFYLLPFPLRPPLQLSVLLLERALPRRLGSFHPEFGVGGLLLRLPH
mmetsp:Transcript_97526/g.275893  ORF Transcript_97526/g.275893 Transcript_97526/m.275893 type:complete len:276 (-) Transcript_97526:860-1687(-)